MNHRDLAETYLSRAERLPGYRGFFDGCCEPRNPGGTAGFGAVIFRGSVRVFERSGMVPASPTTSNNIAEYLAVRSIFDWFAANDPKAAAMIFGDSRLVICQLWGWPPGGKLWKIHGVDDDKPKGHYAEAAADTRELLKKLREVRGYWIPREKNSLADDLSKAELRRLGVEFKIQPENGDHP